MLLDMPEQPFFINLMTPAQRKVYARLIAIWSICLVAFWVWWLNGSHYISFIGTLATSLLLAWTTLLPGYYFYFVWRAKKVNPKLPLPDARVAMIVTKVPSESWALVKRTIIAMQNQIYPGDYDVWLADEDPSAETKDWCQAHRVKISCRKGISEYHRETWPRRTKCKEGNLAYFYDRWGYQQYDIVSQFDADHVPSNDYLVNVVRPFSNSKVGYVAAPSICDSNKTKSWTVRARLYLEASMHGSLQVGYNDGWAPLCIGSHYAIRTQALKSIGGLGPELAEDHSTTLLMNAGGWQGAFAIDAIAHGEGAVGIADSVIQEFQWSRSLVNLLLKFTPKYLGGLPMRLKLQFLFSELWYPLFGLTMLSTYVLALAALINRTPWVRVNYLEFMALFLPLVATCLLVVYWIRLQGWFRPYNAKIISWETVLFQFVRWPWVLWAVTLSLYGVFDKKEFKFRVTPKNESGFKPLDDKILLPYAAVTFTSAAVLFHTDSAGSAEGFYYFNLFNSLEYLVIILLLVGLHFYENRCYINWKTASYMALPLLEIAFLGLWVVSASLLRWNDALQIFMMRNV